MESGAERKPTATYFPSCLPIEEGNSGAVKRTNRSDALATEFDFEVKKCGFLVHLRSSLYLTMIKLFLNRFFSLG